SASPELFTLSLHDPLPISAYYHACNRGKRSIAIDFSKPEGAETVRRLAATADVLIENFKLGGLKKYGLDYESLKTINPRLVYCRSEEHTSELQSREKLVCR